MNNKAFAKIGRQSGVRGHVTVACAVLLLLFTTRAQATVIVSLPPSATEGDGLLTGAGQIQLAAVQTSDVVIGLTSSDPAQVTVPANVTVFTGQSNVMFDLTILDDGVLDGTQTATITASVPGSGTGSASMTIFDKETAALQVSLPATVTKGQGMLQGTVQVSAAVATNVTVALSSSSTNLIQVPASVIIPSGQTSAVFTATVLTDGQINGGQTVNITAHVQNWTDGTAAVTVQDNVNLTVMLPASAWENVGVLTNAGSVSISGTLSSSLVVSLASGNPAKLTVPSSVTIPAGWVSNTFNITLVNNSIADGHQMVTVTASAAGFTNGSASMWVLDDESPPFPFNPQPGNFATNVSASTNLMWNNNNTNTSELILNGGFEAGSLINWTVVPSIYGQFVINDGTVDPPSQDEPLPPFAGNFSALGDESAAGIFYMYQTISIPTNATSATLSWAHRVRNFYSSFSSSQQFQVRICDTNNNVLATPFTTNPGDPLLGDWVQTNCDLTSFAGQTVRVMFWVNPGDYYLDVHVDSVSVQVSALSATNSPGILTNDVYFGTNPTPGPAEFQGSTTNSSWTLPLLSPLTTYYWQIVAHQGGSTTGAVWQFTTAGADHFVWNTIPSPQYVSQPFAVTVTAQDVLNRTVINFNGSVNLTDISGGGQITNRILGNISQDLSSSGSYTLGYSFTPTNDLVVTHVRYYWGSKVSVWTDAGVLLATQIVVSTPGSWLETPLSTPLQLSAGTRYRVAAYSGGGSYYWKTSPFTGFPDGIINQSVYASGDGFPAGTTTGGWPLVDLRYTVAGVGGPVAISPTNSGNFVNGFWTGNLTVQQPVTNVILQANDGNQHAGSSNPFNVVLTNDISVSIVDSPDPVSVGANLTYTLTVTNTGPLDATGVMVTNVLPASVTFVSATSSQGTCTQNSGVIACNLGVVPGATNAIITIVVVPTIEEITITNTATVSRAEADNYLGNNIATAVTTVTNPAISIADASVIEGNVGTTNMIFAVTLTAPSEQTITVNYATSNGTAVAGSDYIATNGTVTFAPGITNETIAVAVIGDILVEPNETFFANLSNPVNGVLGRAQGVGTIINDDGLPGQVYYFTWSVIASPQYTNVPFGVTISAWDAMNNPGTNFTGAVSLYSTSNRVVPIVSGNFTNGIWSGNVAVLNRATNVVLVADDGNGHTGLSNPFNVVPASMAPAILVPPTNQTVLAGGTATFSVAVSGTGPFTYQWQLNGTNLPNGIIMTVAGNGIGSYSGDGGMATNASLNGPSGGAVDASDNLFIVDWGNNRIRKVDTNGIITTMAGNSSGGYSGDGGVATNASLNQPFGAAVDASGNLFIADMGNNVIRKVNPNGIITTVAGNGSGGYSGDGGAATNASLNQPFGAAVDASGKLFIADTVNSVIREVNPNGTITTVAGNGSGGYSGDGGAATNASLNQPFGAALDASGNLFIADWGNNIIRKVDTNGIITTVAGNGSYGYTGDGGAATNASLNQPFGVAVDASGDLFIADYNNVIRKVSTDGIIATVAGNGTNGYSGDGGAATNASLSYPTGVAVDASGNLFIADLGNNCVREVVLFASDPILTLGNVTSNSAGNYSVVITSPYGSVTSSIVTLTVASSPIITKVICNMDGSVTLDLLTTPKTSSRVLATTNLALPVVWQPLYTNVAGASGAWQFTDMNASNSPVRFYRSSTP